MPAKVDLAPGQFIVGGVVCDQNTPKEHIDYYMEQSNRELAMMYPYKVEPLNVGVMLDSLHMEAAATMHHIASTPWTNRIPPGKKIYAQGSFEKLEYTDHIPPGTVIVPGRLNEKQLAFLEKDFVIIDRSIPTRKGMPPAVFEDKEK